MGIGGSHWPPRFIVGLKQGKGNGGPGWHTQETSLSFPCNEYVSKLLAHGKGANGCSHKCTWRSFLEGLVSHSVSSKADTSPSSWFFPLVFSQLSSSEIAIASHIPCQASDIYHQTFGSEKPKKSWNGPQPPKTQVFTIFLMHLFTAVLPIRPASWLQQARVLSCCAVYEGSTMRKTLDIF